MPALDTYGPDAVQKSAIWPAKTLLHQQHAQQKANAYSKIVTKQKYKQNF